MNGVSREEIMSKRSPRGGWTRAQLAEWGVPWPPPRGWKDALERQSKPRVVKKPPVRALLTRDGSTRYVDSNWSEAEWTLIADAVSRMTG
jgi:hypothetical protein